MSKQEDVIKAIMAAGAAHVPVMLVGAPGIGKSAIIEDLAAQTAHLEVIIASTHEPSDFSGLPIASTEDSREPGGKPTTMVRFVAPEWFHNFDESGGILFLDEFTNSPPAVQAACLRLLRERKIGNKELPKNVHILLAANPPDQAADGWNLSKPAANRILHIDYTYDEEAWRDGMISGFKSGIEEGWNTRIVASPEKISASRAMVATFIKTRPELILKVPENDVSGGQAWPSPRTWTYLADVLAHLDPHDAETRAIVAGGLVGPSGQEYLIWERSMDLPDPEDVLNDPSIVTWKNLRDDKAWAILNSAVSWCLAKKDPLIWNKAWRVLGAAAEGGLGDLAAPSSIQLMQQKPPGAKGVPSEIKLFMPLLKQANLYNPEDGITDL